MIEQNEFDLNKDVIIVVLGFTYVYIKTLFLVGVCRIGKGKPFHFMLGLLVILWVYTLSIYIFLSPQQKSPLFLSYNIMARL